MVPRDNILDPVLLTAFNDSHPEEEVDHHDRGSTVTELSTHTCSSSCSLIRTATDTHTSCHLNIGLLTRLPELQHYLQ